MRLLPTITDEDILAGEIVAVMACTDGLPVASAELTDSTDPTRPVVRLPDDWLEEIPVGAIVEATCVAKDPN